MGIQFYIKYLWAYKDFWSIWSTIQPKKRKLKIAFKMRFALMILFMGLLCSALTMDTETRGMAMGTREGLLENRRKTPRNCTKKDGQVCSRNTQCCEGMICRKREHGQKRCLAPRGKWNGWIQTGLKICIRTSPDPTDPCLMENTSRAIY